MQYDKITQKHKHKRKESRHSEMGPVKQNPIHRTVRTAHLSVLMIVHNFSTQFRAQNSFDNLPSYLQTTTIAQMLSIGGEGGTMYSAIYGGS